MSDDRPESPAEDVTPSPSAPVVPATPAIAVPPAAPRRSRMIIVTILLLFAFAGGVAATLWGVNHWGKSRISGLMGSTAEPDDADQDTLTAVQHSATTADALDARMVALSARIEGISAQAQMAGASASRAEALLVAFATRRSLDNGAPLGYLEGELRARFGDAQPRAITTIINAAQEPVTLADLQEGLTVAAPALMGGGSNGDWWTATKREIANLVIVRKAASPSAVPQKALERARQLLLGGRVDAALAEVERLPGRSKVDSWVQMARRYNEARRALDVIEAAAIIEPRTTAMTPSASARAPDDTPVPN